MAAREQRSAPSRFTSITSSSSSSAPIMNTWSRVTPALFTSTSSSPMAWNAARTLLESRTYGSESDAFEALFRRCGDWPRFWKAMRAINPAWFGGDQAAKFSEVLKRAGDEACDASPAHG